jgi:hypothetical protein
MRVKEYIIRLFGQEDNNMYLVHWNSILHCLDHLYSGQPQESFGSFQWNP